MLHVNKEMAWTAWISISWIMIKNRGWYIVQTVNLSPFFDVRSNHTGIAYFSTVYRRYQLPPGKRINTDKGKIHQINYKDGLLYYNYER